MKNVDKCLKDFLSVFLHSRNVPWLVEKHEGIKLYCCPLCDYTSLSKTNLQKHTESVHEENQSFGMEDPDDFDPVENIKEEYIEGKLKVS